MTAILGAGPHGRELADLLGGFLFDDALPGYLPVGDADGEYVAGAAWPQTRRQIVRKARGLPVDGEGTVVFPGAQVSPSATLGQHVHVLYNAVVSHGCTVGDFVTVCSGAVLCGEVTVGDDVFIGANATVIHGGITIGQGAIVGAGAVVVGDVPAGMTVAGNPARLLAGCL